jgi:hypothetical protein
MLLSHVLGRMFLRIMLLGISKTMYVGCLNQQVSREVCIITTYEER